MAAQGTKYSHKILSRRTLITVAIALSAAMFTFFVLTVFRMITISNSIPTIVNHTIMEKNVIKVGLPKRLKIPAINVDAAINYVGLKSDGTMDIEKDPDNVAWYEFGPRPGDEGSAVIAGHYGWIGDKGSVFNELHSLKKGDEISVIDEKGFTTTFVVQESREYIPEADATDVFKSNDGKPHLNLITCEGIWENSKNTYSNRLVVFADKK
jgi:LPXTG-site transpeptidase (sortase) family protein